MKYLLIVTLALFAENGFSQSLETSAAGLPDVFLIGEHEVHYLTLSQQHPATFLSVYQDDIDKAFQGWSELMMDIEDFALELDFDIKGVKLWLHLYFNEDGTIAHLAYYPKPNSRNVPEEHLTAFFKSFVRRYRFLETSEKGYQHSASASFPTYFHRTSPTTARTN